LGEHQVAEGVAIQRLRKALRDALEADEAKQVENDEKGLLTALAPRRGRTWASPLPRRCAALIAGSQGLQRRRAPRRP
jgi:hypothetical protein